MMTLMAYVFLIFQTAKDVVTEMTEILLQKTL